MITIKFTQEEIDQLYEALENIPKEYIQNVIRQMI